MELNELYDDYYCKKSSFKEKKLSQTFKSNTYINSKIDYLKTTSPGFLTHDIMGFDEIQSLKVTGRSKLQLETDYYLDSENKEKFLKKKYNNKTTRVRKATNEMIFKYYNPKFMALRKSMGYSKIDNL